MNPTQPIRRRSDNSIDLDFYRQRAIALRRQAMRDSAALKSAYVGVSLITFIFPLILAGLLTTGPMIKNHLSVTQAKAAQPSTIEILR